MARLQSERDMLRACSKKNVPEDVSNDNVDREGEDVDGEYEVVEGGDGSLEG